MTSRTGFPRRSAACAESQFFAPSAKAPALARFRLTYPTLDNILLARGCWVPC